MRHPVKFQAIGQTADIFGTDFINGVLTDEHAASSYGLPVIVDDEGRTYGPGDVLMVDWMLTVSKDHRDWDRADQGAACDGLPRPPAFTGRVWTPESEGVIRAARDAGYRDLPA